MRFGFLDLLFPCRQHESGKSVESAMREKVCNEEVFRHLIGSESKRSGRSGQLYQILQVCAVDSQGTILRMDSDFAKNIISVILQTVRETDHVGWCRQGYVLGVILTTLDRNSMARLSSRVLPSLREALGAELGEDVVGCLSVRLCKNQEVEVGESVGKELGVS